MTRVPDDATPEETLRDLAKAHIAARCLHVVADPGVADALGEEPATAADLAGRKRLCADALSRMLRLLASEGIFAEREDGRFEHSAASRLLRQDHPRSLRAYARLHGLPGMCTSARRWTSSCSP